AANSGTAIEARGQNATVIINGGSAFNEATTNVRPVLHMTNSTSPNTKVLIDGGSVAALNPDFSDYAIQTYGDVEITGNAKVYADPGSGRAINALGAGSTVIISGDAEVHTASGITIRTNDTHTVTVIVKDNASVYNEGSNNVIWMPGGGSATIQDDAKVEAKGTGIAINSTGSVTVADDAWVIASTGKAINSSATNVDGGFVFAYGSGMAQIITVTPTVTNPGVVVGWDHKKPGPFMIGSIDFLTVEPAGTAVWGIDGGKPGVIYTNGANSGFFPIDVELDTSAAEPVTDIALNPTTLTLVVGDYETLNVIITPTYAVNQIIIWEIEGYVEPAHPDDPSDPLIASISSDGTVTGLLPGTVTIKATAADDSYNAYATCVVTVLPAPVITATADPNGSISPSGDVSVAYKDGMGGDKNFTIIPDDGYAISAVLVDGSDKGSIATYPFEEVVTDHTIHATFALVSYDIIYNGLASGDENTNPDTFDVIDLPFDLDDAVRDGYDFDGWYNAAIGGNLVTNITTTGDKELWARFDTVPIEYNITYNGLEIGDVNTNPDTFDVTDLPFDLDDAVRDGYNFLGWYDAATGGIKVTSINETGDKDLWAVFQKKTSGGGSGTGNATVIPPGGSQNGSSNGGGSQNGSSNGEGNQSSNSGDSGNGSNNSNNSSNNSVYTVIQNFGQYPGAGDSEGIIDGPLNHFVRLMFQGQVVDPDNYVVTENERNGTVRNEGNIVITLKESYDQTFDVGTYTFRAEFTDGYADLTMTVGDGGSQSSDAMPMFLVWAFVLMLLALFVMYILHEDEEFEE
ncbi:MAG: InlB B-repeat-containing protein, partial [Methanimicrococcus sp.]|nr:InlB B-repeat-containing protein [Methanimicrococcus sp.]